MTIKDSARGLTKGLGIVVLVGAVISIAVTCSQRAQGEVVDNDGWIRASSPSSTPTMPGIMRTGAAFELPTEHPVVPPEEQAKVDAILDSCPVNKTLKHFTVFRYAEDSKPSPTVYMAVCSLLALPPPVADKDAPFSWRKFDQKVTPIQADFHIQADPNRPENTEANLVFQQVSVPGRPSQMQLVQVQNMNIRNTVLERTFIAQIQQTVSVYQDMVANYVDQQGKPVVELPESNTTPTQPVPKQP